MLNFCALDNTYICYININPLYTGNPEKGTYTNSEDQNEMQHNAAFH